MKLRITEEERKKLEWLSELSFYTLNVAVGLKEFDKFKKMPPWAEESVRYAYQQGLGGAIKQITAKAGARQPRYFSKPGRRGRELEPFLLQYFLMSDEKTTILTDQLDIASDPEDGMGGLKSIIDAEDPKESDQGEVYKRIIVAGKELRSQNKWNEVLNAMRYIRRRNEFVNQLKYIKELNSGQP